MCQMEAAHSNYYGYPYYWGSPFVWGAEETPILASRRSATATATATSPSVARAVTVRILMIVNADSYEA